VRAAALILADDVQLVAVGDLRMRYWQLRVRVRLPLQPAESESLAYGYELYHTSDGYPAKILN
jgi:hypothetical protein